MKYLLLNAHQAFFKYKSVLLQVIQMHALNH